MKALLLIILALSFGVSLRAAEAKKDSAKDTDANFDALGGNEALLDQARDLNPETSIGIVQKRSVSRDKRIEFDADYGFVAGGEPYLKTKNVGVQINYHFNTKWSAGARYYTHYNEISAEGDRLITKEGLIPDTDHPKSTILGTVNYYPIYGKLNFFDKSVIHYDIYALVGGGQVELKSRTTPTWTAGGGIGFWLSEHLAVRAEVRYQTYNVKPYTGERQLDLTMADFALGYLL